MKTKILIIIIWIIMGLSGSYTLLSDGLKEGKDVTVGAIIGSGIVGAIVGPVMLLVAYNEKVIYSGDNYED